MIRRTIAAAVAALTLVLAGPAAAQTAFPSEMPPIGTP